MRESYGGMWITGLVVSFTFIFAAFLALSINYSKAFRVKNEVLSMIEKGEGVTSNTRKTIARYLVNNNYSTKGKCKGYSYGIDVKGINNYSITENPSGKYSLCVSKVKSVGPNFSNRAFYEVKLFFKFNLPVLGDFATFSVKGQTKDIAYPLDGHCDGKSNSLKCKTKIE